MHSKFLKTVQVSFKKNNNFIMFPLNYVYLKKWLAIKIDDLICMWVVSAFLKLLL